METHSEIKDHLNNYSRDYASSKGFKIGKGAEYDINIMSKKAAENILNPPSQYSNTSTKLLIGIADEKISLLIDQMIAAREIVYEDHEDHNFIGEDTLARAKKIICPMWPIC